MKDMYEELRKTEVNKEHVFHLSWAAKSLMEALTSNNVWNAMHKANESIRNISEFKSCVIPTPNLTEEQALVSKGFHTYMRKGMDCPLSTILYRMIDEVRGKEIWFSFVIALSEQIPVIKRLKSEDKEINFKIVKIRCLEAAEISVNNGNNTTDDYIMLSSLKLLDEEDLKYALLHYILV